MGLTAIRRMLLPDHVGSRKPGEPAMEGQWATILLTWASLASLGSPFVLLLPQHRLLLPLINTERGTGRSHSNKEAGTRRPA